MKGVSDTPPTLPGLYTALSTSTSIRVLQVKPPSADAVLRTELWVVDLDDNPTYNCLSYTWSSLKYMDGNETELMYFMPAARDEVMQSIECNGCRIEIGKNLFDALGTLSSVSEPRTTAIWVDAVCINQLDLQERSRQVGMMGRIYSSANTVVVWLGPSDAETKAAIGVIDTLANLPGNQEGSMAYQGPDLSIDLYRMTIGDTLNEQSALHISARDWAAYARLLSRRYFSRAWVVQETYLAEKLEVYCGAHSVSWQNLSTHNHSLTRLKWLEDITFRGFYFRHFTKTYFLARQQVLVVSNHRSEKAYYTNHPNAERYTSPASGTIEKLRDDVGSLCRGRRASDPRDIVFSVFGMAGYTAIVPDYTASVETIFIDVTRRIEAEHRLFGLQMVEDHSRRQLTLLPSWVPDYTAELGFSPFHSRGGPCYTSGDLPKVLLPCDDPAVLCVRGLQLGTVVQIAGTLADLLHHDGFWDYLLLVQNMNLMYYNGQNRAEALWRTLVGNRTGSGPEAPNDLWLPWVRGSMKLLCAYCALEALAKERYAEESLDITSFLSTQQTRMLLQRYEAIASSHSYRTFPPVAEIEDWWFHYAESAHHPDTRESRNLMRTHFTEATAYIDALHNFPPGRRLFRTQNNYIGTAAQSLQIGDSVFLVQGAGEPWLLRRREAAGSRYEFVANAYVHGVMDGELASKIKVEAGRVEID